MSVITISLGWIDGLSAGSCQLRLPPGATVQNALAVSGITTSRHWDDDIQLHRNGVRLAMGDVLADGDIVNLTPALLANPKELRRIAASNKIRQ